MSALAGDASLLPEVRLLARLSLLAGAPRLVPLGLRAPSLFERRERESFRVYEIDRQHLLTMSALSITPLTSSSASEEEVMLVERL